MAILGDFGDPLLTPGWTKEIAVAVSGGVAIKTAR